MATIKYRGLIGEYGTVTIALTSTVNDLKTAIAGAEGLTSTYYVVSKLNVSLPQQLEVTNYKVTVATGTLYGGGSGNIYFLENTTAGTGITSNPSLQLYHGNTYIFDMSDSTNTNHPLLFSADGGSTEYTTGVTSTGTAGNPGATVTFVVPNDAPFTLQYYCGVHGTGMGNLAKLVGFVASSLTHGALTLDSVGIVDNDLVICKPAKQSTKEARQLQKLYIAQHKRRGGSTGDTTKNYYRTSNTYDIDALAAKYINNTSTDTAGLLLNKHPWVIAGAGSPSINSIQQAVNGGSLTNFDLHYDGNAIDSYNPEAIDEGSISQLDDISDVGGHYGTPTDNDSSPTFENTTPRNFRTYIEFDGNEHLRSLPIEQLDATTGFTIMVVGKLDNPTGTQTFLQSDNAAIVLGSNDTTISVGGAGGGATAPNEADNLWNLHILTFDGTASDNATRLKYRKNKLDIPLTFSGGAVVGTALVAGNKRITVGSNSSTPALLGMTGAIGEVIVFSKALNTTEIANAETYLYNKWFPQAPVPVLMGLKALGLTLNNKLSITKDNFSGVQTAIESAHVSFNVFAVVTDDQNTELLGGIATSSGHHYFNNEGFIYTSSLGRLSTGNGIEEFSGGTENSLSVLDGNKWMAMAVYDGTTAGFKGIIVWIFTDNTVDISSSVNGARAITSAASIFQHMNTGTYAQHHTVIIGTDGTIATSNTTGTTGWNFSNNQQATANGYYQTTQFSNDDGFWAARLNTVIDANGDGDFKGSNGYGLGAVLGDTSSQLWWNGADTNEDNYIGFVFTGDR